jgi:hypothetical protein
VAIFLLVGALSGSVATYVLGFLGDHYQIDIHPERTGMLLGITVLISYGGCIPFFILNGREYANLIITQKEIVTYIIRTAEAQKR